jgi:sugar phosphate isomerase/epimerase
MASDRQALVSEEDNQMGQILPNSPNIAELRNAWEDTRYRFHLELESHSAGLPANPEEVFPQALAAREALRAALESCGLGMSAAESALIISPNDREAAQAAVREYLASLSVRAYIEGVR